MANNRLSALAASFFANFETRFKRKEKDAFLERCKAEFAELGYMDSEVIIQKAGGGKNLMVGPPDADILITAHYDTPAANGLMLVANPVLGQALGTLAFPLVILWLAGFLAGFLSVGNPFVSFLFPGILILLLILGFTIKNKHNHNDNTSGVLGVFRMAEFVASNPTLKDRCAFVLFDNEEWGLLGSSAFAKWRKKNYPQKKDSAVINLDCIGYGDILLLAATKKHEDWHKMAAFFQNQGFKIAKKQSSLVFLSDHMHFAGGVMLSFAKKSRLGFLYLPNVHTRKDTVCDLDNIERLSASIFKYLCETIR
ncbi:MAG: M28 family metallopeptidase [Clostridia bacterium]|nr:M28 family metallopeptidase [Clostridia bacterium]